MSSQLNFAGRYSRAMGSKDRVTIPKPLRDRAEERARARGEDGLTWYWAVERNGGVRSATIIDSEPSAEQCSRFNPFGYDTKGRTVIGPTLADYFRAQGGLLYVVGQVNSIGVFTREDYKELHPEEF